MGNQIITYKIMTKSELLTDVEAKVLRVVSTIEEPDAAKNAVNVKQYITHVLEQDGLVVRGRNIGWYVVDEGLPTEAAFYRDNPTQKRSFADVVDNYANQITPLVLLTGSYIRAEVLSVNEKTRTAMLRAYKKNADQTATTVTLLVYKNGSQDLTHVEVV